MIFTKESSTAKNKNLVATTTYYQLIAGHFYKLGENKILRRCVMEHEIPIILAEVHEGIVRGNYAGKVIMNMVLRAELWWLTVHNDSKEYC
jgi:hypothetical protein